MPIYEYESVNPEKGCQECIRGFEVIQCHGESQITECPRCGQAVRKIISWCRAAIVESSPGEALVEKKIAGYEREGMWSHAAELADTHSERTKDQGMKMRALDGYKKAGYDLAALERHSKSNDP
jgi:putative FmdB family regulatory protein